MAFYGFLSSHNFGRKLTGFKNDHLGTWFEIFPNFGFFIRMLNSAVHVNQARYFPPPEGEVEPGINRALTAVSAERYRLEDISPDYLGN